MPVRHKAARLLRLGFFVGLAGAAAIVSACGSATQTKVNTKPDAAGDADGPDGDAEAGGSGGQAGAASGGTAGQAGAASGGTGGAVTDGGVDAPADALWDVPYE